MSKFAPIAPIQIQDILGDAIGDYHLLIAPKVLSSPNRYREYYERYARSHPDLKIIMDNGVIETGEPMDAHQLMKACKLVGTTWLVLPDKLGDEEETVRLSTEAVGEIQKLRYFGAIDEKKLMVVVQGATFGELQSCASALIDLPGVSAICVPRRVTATLGTRAHIVKWINQQLTDLPIHLLGLSHDLQDDFMCAKIPGVMGIDSAMPVWAAMYGIELDVNIKSDRNHLTNELKRPTRFWNWREASEATIMNMTGNIEIARSWLGNQ